MSRPRKAGRHTAPRKAQARSLRVAETPDGGAVDPAVGGSAHAGRQDGGWVRSTTYLRMVRTPGVHGPDAASDGEGQARDFAPTRRFLGALMGHAAKIIAISESNLTRAISSHKLRILGMGRKAQKNDSLPGSLDMLILRTLSRRDLHGYDSPVHSAILGQRAPGRGGLAIPRSPAAGAKRLDRRCLGRDGEQSAGEDLQDHVGWPQTAGR